MDSGVIIAVEMSEDMSFGNWAGVTPEAMKNYSEAKLNLASELNPGGPYDVWARTELARRRDTRIQELISSLNTATDKVHMEVARLADSSGKVEHLTIKLKTFTIWLIFFAGIQIAIAGVQTWKMFQREPPPRVLLGLPQPTAPQTPLVPEPPARQTP